jgi:hypothetical protein
MKKIVSLSILFLLASCSAKFVHKDYKNKRGVVSFMNEGASSVIDARREDAEKKMASFCKGNYEILAETSKDQYAGTVASMNSQTSSSANGSYNNQTGRFTASGSSQTNSWGSAFAMHQNHIYLMFQCK